MSKFNIARDILDSYNIELLNKKIETPEIQSLDVEAVAKYSADYASKKLKSPTMVTDVGYYIPALNDFPGPFIKFINQTLGPEDILALMHGKEDRRVIMKECLAYKMNSQSAVTFITEQIATIALKPEGSGSTIDQLLILEGFDKPKGTLPDEIVHEHWKKSLDIYHDLGRFISK